jgi:two-component system response regulator YesN
MRLLIVDDGHYIVEYLKHLLDWKSLGVEYIETTTNSINAKQILNNNDFDILITDIRMPEVSGIDLLQHVEENGLKTKVIILSGYSQFEYAQQAVRLGAVDYLLKPVDKEDMEKAMRKVTLFIQKKMKNTPVAWDKLDGLGYLLNIISEHCPPRDEYKPVHSALVDESFCFFQVRESEERDEMILRDYSLEYKSFIWRTGSKLIGLVPASGADSLTSILPNLIVSEKFEFSQRNVVRHLFYRFIYEEKVCPSDLEIVRTLPSIEPGECELARKQIQRNFAQLASRKHKIIYLLELTSTLYTMDTKLQQADVVDWIFTQLSTPDSALPIIMISLSQLFNGNKSSNQMIIQTIHDYIVCHISDDLSLEELGKIVHLHPVYLSKFYKQETGQNLSGHIAMKRLEKAAQLLINSNLHVVDISQLVGYKKTQYFIKLFKDQYGTTPYQYRRIKCEAVKN